MFKLGVTPPPPHFGRKIAAVALIALFSLTGCSITIPVNKEVTATNYKTAQVAQEAKTKYAIAIVTPSIVVPNSQSSQNNASSSQNALMALMAARTNNGFVANVHFANQYQATLANAFQQSFADILNKKGFATTGPFTTLSDMTHPEKRDAYLATTPVLTINFVDSAAGTGKTVDKLYYSQSGTLALVGDFYVKVIEPLTEQTLINKRINLADLNIAPRPYKYEVQIATKGADVTETTIMKMKAPSSITDSVDKAMAELLNEFFSKAVDKIVVYLAREELLNLEKDVEGLKALKRF
jgi:hypothetical protein